MARTICGTGLYLKVCRECGGCEHVLALTMDPPIVLAALDAAKRDLGWLVSEEDDDLLRLDWQRMLELIEAARLALPQAVEPEQPARVGGAP